MYVWICPDCACARTTLDIGAELRIGSWKPRRSRGRRRGRIEPRNARSGTVYPIFRLIHLSHPHSSRPHFSRPTRTHTLSAVFTAFMLTNVCATGHQAHLSLLPPIQSQSPGPNRRLIQALIQFQGRRARAQAPIARGHAQENGMRSVGVHEDAASRVNLLVAVIAVGVQTVDTLIVCILWRCHLYSSCLHPIYTPPLCATSMELIHREHSDNKKRRLCHNKSI